MAKSKVGFVISPIVAKPQTKATRYRFEIALDIVRDAKIIDKLEKQTNKSDYVRRLIAKDIEA